MQVNQASGRLAQMDRAIAARGMLHATMERIDKTMCSIDTQAERLTGVLSRLRLAPPTPIKGDGSRTPGSDPVRSDVLAETIQQLELRVAAMCERLQMLADEFEQQV